jgi:hypothetical protein
MEEGEIEIDSIERIGFPDITPELARESGFLGVLDLLKVAKHGRGENIYLTICGHAQSERDKARLCRKKANGGKVARCRPAFPPNQDSRQNRLGGPRRN